MDAEVCDAKRGLRCEARLEHRDNRLCRGQAGPIAREEEIRTASVITASDCVPCAKTACASMRLVRHRAQQLKLIRHGFHPSPSRALGQVPTFCRSAGRWLAPPKRADPRTSIPSSEEAALQYMQVTKAHPRTHLAFTATFMLIRAYYCPLSRDVPFRVLTSSRFHAKVRSRFLLHAC